MIRPQTLKACRGALQRVLSELSGRMKPETEVIVLEALADATEDWAPLNSVQRESGTVTQLLGDRLVICVPNEETESLIRVFQIGLEAIRHGREPGPELSPKFRRRVLLAGGRVLRSLTGGS